MVTFGLSLVTAGKELATSLNRRQVLNQYFLFYFCSQTEIAKRLNAICAQIIPFLSQEVSGSQRPWFFSLC